MIPREHDKQNIYARYTQLPRRQQFDGRLSTSTNTSPMHDEFPIGILVEEVQRVLLLNRLLLWLFLDGSAAFTFGFQF